MGLLDNALQAIKNQYQETKGNVGLLMSDPKQYMSGLNKDAAEYNRLSSLALQAERNAYRGMPVSAEQAAAKQYIDQQQQDMALGFTGSIKPTKGIIGINAGSKEIDNLFNKIANKAENLKLPIEYGASNVSGSRYLTFKNPEGIDYQIRVSNHGDMYPNQLAGTGERFSIDPRSGNSYQDAINWLNEKGINLNKRTKKEKEKTFEEKYGHISEEELLKIREWAAKNR
jgi:hypothetical protein